MNINEVISSKLLKQYPESFKIFEDSCKYTIDNGLHFIKGVLLYREKDVAYNEQKIIAEELQQYLNGLGYKNSIIYHKETFHTRKGHEYGTVFVVFLSTAGIEAYIKESQEWSKSIASNSRYDVEKPRPIYEQIRYLSIYQKKKNARRSKTTVS
jgi:hypothetical protein